jgi:predicted GNAT superfamily acetyltransferase
MLFSAHFLRSMHTIRDLTTLQDYQACVALQDETWGEGFSERVPTAILRVSQIIGGVAAGAFDDAGQLIGFVFGMTGVRDGRLVHWSDMLAVREPFRGKGLGDQLKQYQRDKVRALGVSVMLWTFDPLVARNAHFNINRLGARAAEYRPDMYGSNTGSALHGSLPTDRFIAEWDLDRTHVPGPGAEPADIAAPVVNPLASNGAPLVELNEVPAHCRVQVPADFGAVQRAGGDLPLRWRLAVRQAMLTLFDRGFRVTGFVRGTGTDLPHYVLMRSSEAPR